MIQSDIPDLLSKRTPSLSDVCIECGIHSKNESCPCYCHGLLKQRKHEDVSIIECPHNLRWLRYRNAKTKSTIFCTNCDQEWNVMIVLSSNDPKLVSLLKEYKEPSEEKCDRCRAELYTKQEIDDRVAALLSLWETVIGGERYQKFYDEVRNRFLSPPSNNQEKFETCEVYATGGKKLCEPPCDKCLKYMENDDYGLSSSHSKQ